MKEKQKLKNNFSIGIDKLLKFNTFPQYYFCFVYSMNIHFTDTGP